MQNCQSIFIEFLSTVCHYTQTWQMLDGKVADTVRYQTLADDKKNC